MTRPFIVALVAATALASAPALAQQQPAPQAQDAPRAAAPAPIAQAQPDPQALLDARVAALRAGLRLSGEQETLFEPVEQAMRDAHAARAEREAQAGVVETEPALDFMTRMERRTALAAARTQEQVQLVEALRPLWDDLDEGQRATLPALLGMRGPGMWGMDGPRPRMERPMRMRDRGYHHRMGRDGRGPDRAR